MADTHLDVHTLLPIHNPVPRAISGRWSSGFSQYIATLQKLAFCRLTSFDHFSVETPSATPNHSPGEINDNVDSDPYHPLLAYRPPLPTQPTASANLLKMQTAAAHGSPIRPRPVPQQNLLQVTSDDSVTSSSSSRSSLEMFSAPEVARCSRCQRTPSTDVRTGQSNMVQYGLNLWYCSRCASMVGLTER
ncbi:hypothetical protein Q7P37_002889 [Cladosporium fusiforme]